MKQQGRFGIYVHWPFCLAKCPYCDFNSHVRERIDQDAWQEAYLRSIDYTAALTPGRQVRSIYFGGGTPSLMQPQTVAAIIDRIQSRWAVANDIEITLEANPTSVEAEKLRGFRDAGVNRVSLGVQALNDADLKFLGRKHSAAEAIRAVQIAGNIFDRFSFDLIYARPGQTLEAWRQELEQALQYAQGHMSLYQLTIERGTPFQQDYAQKKFIMPEEDLAADFYSLTQDIMEAHGLPAYEVSNHARPGEESRHNLVYWHYGDYAGIGPGAHGRLTLDGKKFATSEHRVPEIWLENVKAQGKGAHPFEEVPPEEQFTEGLMMGLRLREGVSLSGISQDWRDYMDEARMAEAQKQAWLIYNEKDGCRVRLTREGLLRLNAMVPYLLQAEPLRAARLQAL